MQSHFSRGESRGANQSHRNGNGKYGSEGNLRKNPARQTGQCAESVGAPSGNAKDFSELLCQRRTFARPQTLRAHLRTRFFHQWMPLLQETSPRVLETSRLDLGRLGCATEVRLFELRRKRKSGSGLCRKVNPQSARG